MEGYGLYWYCLELVAANVDKHNLTFELEHDAEIIAHDTGIHFERVEEMMRYMVQLRLFEEAGGHITCLKMATRTDEYTQKIIRDHGLLPRTSGHTPDSVPTKSDLKEQNRTEQNRTEQKNTMATGVAVVDKTDIDLFEIFWKEYPRKTNKQAAEKAFRKLSPDESLTSNLVADCRLRLEQGQWVLDEKQFIPHASTYLNNRRWFDEVVPRAGAPLSSATVAQKTQSIIEKLNSEESWLCNL